MSHSVELSFANHQRQLFEYAPHPTMDITGLASVRSFGLTVVDGSSFVVGDGGMLE